MQLLSRIRRRRVSRGQSLVEFALILPIMLMFLAGVIDLGRVFYATISLNNAAREGAFQASQTPTSYQPNQDCDTVASTTTNMIVCRIQFEAKSSPFSIDANDITVTCNVGGCPKQAGSTVVVEVRGTFRLITPLLSIIFGSQDLPMSAKAIAQMEYLPAPNTQTLPPGPVAQISASQTVGTSVPLTITFDGTGSSGSPTDWQWDFGDGGTATGSAIVDHTYTAAGSYTVTLTVINLAGTDDGTIAIQITVPDPTPTPTPTGPVPTPTPTPTPTPSCAYPPNVIGESPSNAAINLQAAGFTSTAKGELTTGQKNKIQAMNPDFTQCLPLGTDITILYRPN